MERCFNGGTAICPSAGGQTSVALRGFDDRWRCPSCHRVHIEDVYRQAGESDPETIDAAMQAKPTNTDVVRTMAQRSSAIGKQFRKGGEYYGVALQAREPFGLTRESIREASSLTANVPRGVGERDADYSARLMRAYRAVRQKGR